MKNVQDVYCLSPMQREMLVYSLYAPDEGANIEQVHWTWRGPLDPDAFERAWQRLLSRHSVLRTAFFWGGMPEPVQVVRTRATVKVERLDWTGLCEEERSARLAEHVRLVARQGFKMSIAPLLRVALATLAEDFSLVVWSYHHILLDGWSAPLCLRELFLIYQAELEGRQLNLGVARPYREYIAWLARQDVGAAKHYWTQALLNTPPLSLPMDLGAGERRGASTINYAICEQRLSPDATARLLEAARRHRLTLSTLVQGAWAILLARYSGEQSVIFGVTVSGRPPDLPDVDTMVGLFINTLPLRARVDPETRALPWLQALQAEQLAARQHGFLSISELRGIARSDGSPLFESVLVVENFPSRGLLEEGGRGIAEIGAADHPLSGTGLPLTIVIMPGVELSLLLVYDVMRFERSTADRMPLHLRTLLDSLVTMDGGSARLGDISMLPTGERRTLAAWGDARTEYPHDLSIPALFEAQVRKSPDAIALVWDGQTLTYDALNRRANRLARHLRSLGIGPEVAVGLFCERSPEAILALLAILKAGGAYVPLDPTYPPQRLSLLIQDTALRVALVQPTLMEEWPDPDTLLVPLDLGVSITAFTEERDLELDLSPELNAYIVFTSGSTGRPRGVVVPHRAVVRLATARRHLRVAAADVFFHHAPLAFDASTFEIWSALLNGASIAVPPPGLLTIEQLGLLLARYEVTTLWLTAPLFHQIIELAPATLSPVRSLIAGGDTLSLAQVKAAHGRLPAMRIINGYGPTENTTFTTLGPVQYPLRGRTVPLGTPIDNTSVYVLDDLLRPAPIGAPGELYAGGDGLARGYWARPGLTAERFLPDPFSPAVGARMYRTGDRARWLEDGTLEFLGRRDHQIKLRGFRVELGEIEAALAAHTTVREAIVLAREDVPGNKRLVAYLLPAGEAPSPAALREHLGKTLPEHMIPGAFVLLDAWPLTLNGKIDRKALPPPHNAFATGREDLVLPRDPLELSLAALWEDILGTRPIGVRDDFFALGGHSLLAVRLSAQIESRLGRPFSLVQLFQHTTVESLAAALRAGSSTDAQASPLIALTPNHDGTPLFCVHAIGGSALSFLPLARALGEARTVYAFHARGVDDDAVPFDDVEAMAHHYAELLRAARPTGAFWLAAWSFGGVVAFEMARHLTAAGAEVAGVILLDAWLPWHDQDQASDDLTLLSLFAREQGIALPEELGAALRGSSRDERVFALAALAAEQGVVPAAMAESHLRRSLHVCQAHLRAFTRYRPRPAQVRLSLVRPEELPSPEAASLLAADPSGGWGALAPSPVTLRSAPGNHFNLLRPPHIARVAEIVRALLEEGSHPCALQGVG